MCSHTHIHTRADTHTHARKHARTHTPLALDFSIALVSSPCLYSTPHYLQSFFPPTMEALVTGQPLILNPLPSSQISVSAISPHQLVSQLQQSTSHFLSIASFVPIQPCLPPSPGKLTLHDIFICLKNENILPSEGEVVSLAIWNNRLGQM